MKKISQILSEEKKMQSKLDKAIEQVRLLKIKTESDILGVKKSLEEKHNREIENKKKDIDAEIDSLLAKIKEDSAKTLKKFDIALTDRERIEEEVYKRFIKRNS